MTALWHRYSPTFSCSGDSFLSFYQHKSPLLDPLLGQFNPRYIHIVHFFKIHFNILSSTTPSWCICMMFTNQIFYALMFIPWTSNVPHISVSPIWVPQNCGWRVHISNSSEWERKRGGCEMLCATSKETGESIFVFWHFLLYSVLKPSFKLHYLTSSSVNE